MLSGMDELLDDRFVSHARSSLTTVKEQCKQYLGHSFQNGVALTATGRGIPDTTIKTLGRWESLSYLLHTKLSREQLVAIAKQIKLGS